MPADFLLLKRRSADFAASDEDNPPPPGAGDGPALAGFLRPSLRHGCPLATSILIKAGPDVSVTVCNR